MLVEVGRGWSKRYQGLVTVVGARRTYGFRDLIAILPPDFGFNWENGRFWI